MRIHTDKNKDDNFRSIVIFVRLILLILIISCSTPESGKSTGKSTHLFKDHEIWSPTIVISKGKNISVQSTADKMEKSGNEDALLIGNVITNFFGEDGGHGSVLYSDSAKINELSNNFEAFGHVKVISDSGLTLKTHKITWDNRYKLVLSKDSVMFTTKQQDTLYGIGFESDVDLSHWRIEKPTGVTSRGFLD